MPDKATTVKEYLAALPEDRRAAINAVRDVVLKNLDAGFEEGIAYGMIGYVVPHSIYPAGYHCDPKQPLGFAALASQKNYMALHMMCLYTGGDTEGDAAKLLASFEKDWAKTGKKLDMGKACIRFKRVDDLALDVIGKTIAKVTVKKWIALNEKFAAARKAAKRK